jgi:hypothetical protein
VLKSGLLMGEPRTGGRNHAGWSIISSGRKR